MYGGEEVESYKMMVVSEFFRVPNCRVCYNYLDQMFHREKELETLDAIKWIAIYGNT